MNIILGIVALLALGYVVSLFLSKKSSKTQKLVALGALILSGIVLIICGAVIIFGGTEAKDLYAFPLEIKPAEPEGMPKTAEFLILVVIILVLLGLIVFFYLREQKQLAQGKDKNNTQNKGF
jgi:TRAP-type C4-dicarboxylate transport system permease small subunit